MRELYKRDWFNARFVYEVNKIMGNENYNDQMKLALISLEIRVLNKLIEEEKE